MESGAEAVARSGSVIGFVAVTLVRGYASMWAGDLVGAEADLRACRRVVPDVAGGDIAATIASAALAEVLVARGELTEAVEVADLGAPVADASNGGINLLRARALVRLAQGDPGEALVELAACRRRLEAIGIDNPPWCAWRAPTVAALWALGRHDEAGSLVADELAQARARQDPVQTGVALRWAAVLAPEARREELLLESVSALAETEARLELHLSQLELGAAQRRVGRRGDAKEWLLRAREGAHRCGAGALLARADTELAAAGARPRRIETSGVLALTASERRVCDLVVAGLRNRDIAQRLFLSPRTVEVHLSRSYRKLGISGRSQLAAALAGDGGAAPGPPDDGADRQT